MTTRSLAVRGRHRAAAAWLAIGVVLAAGTMSVANAAAPANIGDLAQAVAAGLQAATAPPVIVVPPASPAPEIAFVTPVPGYEIDSPFGLRKLPWEAQGRLHAGVDIAAPLGTAVQATADGVVTRVGTSPSYGRFLEVAHADGLSSFYAHLGGQAVAEGAAIKAGQTVGYMGSTGDSTGSHLHFEIREAGKSLNPAMFMGRTFAKAGDLPLAAAALFGPLVRIAQVSGRPPSQRGRIRLASARTGAGRVHGVVRMGG